MGKVDAAVEILNQQSSKGCSSVLNEMWAKGLKPDIVSFSSLIGGLSREGKFDGAIKFFHDLEGFGVKPNAITYNSIMLGLCKAQQTDCAIDFLVYMVSRGFNPTGVSYAILIEVKVSVHVVQTIILVWSCPYEDINEVIATNLLVLTFDEVDAS
ncbi:hypothetical protein GH714_003693 [Hevea brasiliensis]|uniref:Pentacotripeptide-repeat region of PRORP domain-containing protein n=1 Tax=Hevea brasiliensis TaxID=3981 RepID=A0A6A6NFF4_HEVBR|nr:hypothetical protein GH714_003693 [Hevea brasiliensis]